MLTKEQASALLDAHAIVEILYGDEEMELLRENNPVLAEAYYALNRIAHGAKEVGQAAP